MAQSRLAPSMADGALGTTAAIEARELRKDFGDTTVLRDLSLRIEPSEIFGLIGPSGSGKSTTIHLLCGHLRSPAACAGASPSPPRSSTIPSC